MVWDEYVCQTCNSSWFSSAAHIQIDGLLTDDLRVHVQIQFETQYIEIWLSEENLDYIKYFFHYFEVSMDAFKSRQSVWLIGSVILYNKWNGFWLNSMHTSMSDLNRSIAYAWKCQQIHVTYTRVWYMMLTFISKTHNCFWVTWEVALSV